jgi:hypothetical protein
MKAKGMPILRGITIIAMGFRGVDKGFIQRLRYSSTFSFFGGSEAGF